MNTTNHIAGRIEQIMIENSLNQEKFARLLDVTQPAVSNYLKGRIPPPQVLLRISELSGKSIEWILTGSVRTGRIEESKSQYRSDSELLKKINSLPDNVRTCLLELIQSLYLSNNNK